MSRNSQLVVAAVVGAALAAGATSLLWKRPTAVPVPAARMEFAEEAGTIPASPTDYDARIRELAAALEQERDARTSLATEVASLRGELARVRPGGGTRTAAHAASVERPATRGDDGASRTGPRPLDVDALVGAGFAEETVREFKEGVDQLELDRLYLRDIASREGWLNTSRFREESEALQLDMGSTRDEYGEEFYDWMLYATGHPNRVEVGDVMSGSAAEEVGMRPGDLVLSYADQRIFGPAELRDATAGGEVGELAPVEVLRDGRRMRLLVPRGPLGIRVGGANVEPQRSS